MAFVHLRVGILPIVFTVRLQHPQSYVQACDVGQRPGTNTPDSSLVTNNTSIMVMNTSVE